MEMVIVAIEVLVVKGVVYLMVLMMIIVMVTMLLVKFNVSDSSRYRDDNDTIYGSLESGSFGFLNSNGDTNVGNLVSDSFGSSSCGGIDESGISVCSYGDRGFRTGIEMSNANIGNALRRDCNDQNARLTCPNNDVDIEEDRNGVRNCIGVDSLCCGVGNNDFVQNVETGINTDFTKDTLPFDPEDSASYNMYMAGLVEQSLNQFKTSRPRGSKPSSINPVNHENVMKFWSDPDKVKSYLFEKYLPFKSDLDSTSCSNEPRTSRNRKTVKKTRPASKPFGEKKNIHTIFTVNGSDSKDIKYIGKNVACFADKD
ncbi:Hypothetical predicted protein [Mytilus galloprovincialis]|uniref:Uncharacterized protein n=1 Tax=Mytilus galloprovincialis TaxID=29158 RepID=A0A8B6C3V4_MYTGA|nr:Hypothetical predicted protein [Mytilus galloprovincialis]